jgi:hypothetical protein
VQRPIGISCGLLAIGIALAGCGDTTIESGDSASQLPYPEAMAEICARTEALLADLPEPSEEISVADFATEVAGILADEADATRDLDAPDELDDDHRAFVANTDEQAAGWTVVAQSDDDEIGDEMTRIAELTLGRDDLATEMGIPECRRGT